MTEQIQTNDVLDQLKIVENAVEAVIANFQKVDSSKKAISKIEGGQLTVLNDALKDYPEPMTEKVGVWDNTFKVGVMALLKNAKATNGAARYSSASSRDVMVNLFKVATMGLTLAKQDSAFAPTAKTAANLKKYAADVRPKLQAAIDPSTNEPRLRAGKPKPTKKLAPHTYYWLIGCEDSEKGLSGANAVLGGDGDIRKLEKQASRLKDRYQSFLYCEAKMEPLKPKTDEGGSVVLMIQNSAVSASTINNIYTPIE